MRNDDAVDMIVAGLLRECEEDWVALWVVIAAVRRTFGANIAERRLREVTLTVVDALLSSGRVEAGWPRADGGWEPWRLSRKAVLVRIEADWSALGRIPTIGSELVWFTTPTPKSQASKKE